MVCGLTKDALDVLHGLYWEGCMSEKHSKSVMAIIRDMPDGVDVEAALKELRNAGLVGCKKKRECNYWASAGPAISRLQAHGYAIHRGGTIRL